MSKNTSSCYNTPLIERLLLSTIIREDVLKIGVVVDMSKVVLVGLVVMDIGV